MDFLDLFLAQNPWQKGEKFKIKPFIERTIFPDLIKWLEREEIMTVIGPRQSGKTTLLLKTIEHLLAKKQPPETIFYFNFDQEAFQTEMGQPEKLFSFVSSRSASWRTGRCWLFLDEIQRLKEPGLYLKILYDLPKKPLKIIVSGSSSLLLRAKIKEHLTGRQISFSLLPLSFSEAASYLGFKKLNQPLVDLVQEMAVFGGYPKPFQEKNRQIKEQLLFQLYQDYVRKDIRDFAGLEKVTVFNKLTALLAYQIGNLINQQELASSCQADIRTIIKYLEVLEQTFVIKLLAPYFTNRRREMVKMPKLYFLDNGLRNAQLNNFQVYSCRPDQGGLFENLVLTEIIKLLPPDSQLRYWRTQAGAEVDFVWLQQGKLIPIEVKSHLSQPKLPLGLRSFINRYQPERAFIISENFQAEKTYQKTQVKFLPFFQLPRIFT